MRDQLTCAMVTERDLVARFIAGRVSAEEAEALEEHCMGCELCWTELRLATRVRAAAKEPRETRLSGVMVRRAALAAAILLTAAGARMFWQSEAEQDVERGAAGGFDVIATRTAERSVELDWPDIEGAAGYEVSVFGPDGSVVMFREIETSEVKVAASDTGSDTVATSASVTAFDALGNRLAESAPIAIPALPEPD